MIGVLLFVLCGLTLAIFLDIHKAVDQLTVICRHLDRTVDQQVQNLMEQAKHTGNANSD